MERVYEWSIGLPGTSVPTVIVISWYDHSSWPYDADIWSWSCDYIKERVYEWFTWHFGVRLHCDMLPIYVADQWSDDIIMPIIWWKGCGYDLPGTSVSTFRALIAATYSPPPPPPCLLDNFHWLSSEVSSSLSYPSGYLLQDLVTLIPMIDTSAMMLDAQFSAIHPPTDSCSELLTILQSVLAVHANWKWAYCTKWCWHSF